MAFSSVDNQRGIALVQVLLISTVISLLALYFVAGSRDQVTSAKLLMDRAEAQVKLHSAKNRLLFSLMTQQTHKTQSDEDDWVNLWRFDNQVFSPESGLEVQIQDQSSLIALRYLSGDTLENLLNYLFGEQIDAATVAARVKDWQDGDSKDSIAGTEQTDFGIEARNGQMQTLNELRFISGLSEAQFERLKPYLSLSNNEFFNVNGAPEAILRARYKDDTDALLQQRQQGPIDNKSFYQATGQWPENADVFYPSVDLAVVISAKEGEAKVSERWLLKLQPTKKSPFLVVTRQ